ncbi:major facilitator superfamily domain-containing protein [Dichotomocladium elegans]|nr:major facilitator superfamily domain-containing protein [Dichotomocladium elegans]
MDVGGKKHLFRLIIAALKRRFLIKPPVEDDPRLLSTRTKGYILVILCLCAASPGFSSTIYFPGIPTITSDLNAPSIAITLTAALFILFMGIAPVFWAAVSDYYCVRRALFILSMLIFAMASLGSALMNNIWGLVVLRCVQAVGASCGQSVGAGVIADCYPVEKRGTAFGKYFFGLFFGPLVGPILGGGLITSALSWRTTFWFCFAFALTVIVLIAIAYPETYRDDIRFDSYPGGDAGVADNVSARSTLLEAAEERDLARNNDTVPIETPHPKTTVLQPIPTANAPGSQPKAATTARKKPINPIRPFLMLRHPHVLMASLVSGVAFGCMFAVETIIPDLFQSRYRFNAWQTGLSYLGAGVGNMCGAFITSTLSDRLLLRARKRRNGRHKIEDRLALNLWPAGFIFVPFGLLLFGWGIERHMSYWTGIIGFGIQNFGMNQIMSSTSAYLVDAAPGEGASASAAGNFTRMIFACVLTLAANPMVASIGPGYTCVFLTALGYASMILLIALKVYGPRIRRATGFEQPEERKTEN